MKKLKISLSHIELARISLNQPTILLGRSPICDYVIRKKGIAAIHFIIEWVGVGEFDINHGKWVVIPIVDPGKISDSEAKKLGYGEGVLLAAEAISLNDFQFQIVEDVLAESDLQAGLVTDSLITDNRIHGNTERNILEMVSVNTDSGSVIDVIHFPVSKARNFHFDKGAQIKFNFLQSNNKIDAQIDFINMDSGIIQHRKAVGTEELHLENKQTIKFENSDFLHIQRNMKDYYFRFVPSASTPPAVSGIWSDRFLVLFISLLLPLALFLFYIKSDWVQLPPKPIEPPPRIAKIEIKETIKQPIEPKIEEEKKEPEKNISPKEIIKDQSESTPANQKPKSASPQGSVNNQELAKANEKDTTLVAPAPVKKNNIVGLLGAMKAKNNSTVKADQILNNAIVSDTPSTSGATLKMNQPSIGSVSNQTKTSDLFAGASKKLKLEDTVRGDSVAPMAGSGTEGQPLSDDVNFDKVIGTYAEGTGLDNEEESIVGGLDKESIRRTLKAFKKDVGTCYDRALATKAQIAGKIKYNWHINADGTVGSVSLVNATTNSVKLESCVMSVIKKIVFPKAANAKPTIVIYTFVFQQKNKN